jgi:hypothetical protein
MLGNQQIGRRWSVLGLTLGLAVFSALGAWAQPKAEIRTPAPLDVAQAENEGRALVAELLSQDSAQPSTNTGVLTVRLPDGTARETAVRFEGFAVPSGWRTSYESKRPAEKLLISRAPQEPNQYFLTLPPRPGSTNASPQPLSANQTMIPFANSDFWVADLGLEFFHWPRQLVLKKEMRRGRACRVLRSINPAPTPGAYSKVDSWIDTETGGIIHAEAFDAQGQLLKVFDPKEFKKVQGQWQLEGMEIRNRQTGSRTRIEFNLNRP